MKPSSAVLLALLGLATSLREAGAACDPFHAGLESAAGVVGTPGGILGPVFFVPAINGHGASFGGSGRVFFQDPRFASLASGSISLWFRKTTADTAGGIAQFGIVGTTRSVGLFYDGGADLYVELRNDNGDQTSAGAPGVLADGAWRHIVAAWRPWDGGTGLYLFVDGRYRGFSWLPGTYTPIGNQLELGSTGFYGRAEGVIDEVRVFDAALLDGEVYGEYVYSGLRFRRQAGTKPVSTGPVQIADGRLLVEGRPFRVKSVGYQPTPVGQDISRAVLDAMYTDPAIIARDMTLLRGMHVNTIRLWSEPPDTTLLDACYNNGVDPIYVVVGYWIPQWVDYADPAVTAGLEANFRAFVRRFKDHPAVLGWGLGNENNLVYAGVMADWFTLANRLAGAAHAEEGAAYHPSILINGGLMDLGDVQQAADDVSLPEIDVWGLNLYWGADPNCHFDYYARLTAKPLLLTEYGIDAWNNALGTPYLQTHALYLAAQWRTLRPQALGGSVMAYSDEWWKAGTPAIQDFGGYGTTAHPDGYSNEEWYGLVSAQDAGSGPDILTPRPAYFALAEAYRDRVGDFDADGDADLADFAALQRCQGSNPDAPCLAAFDLVTDGAVGVADYLEWSGCAGGPGVPARCAP